MPDKTQLELVIFDLDGLLVDSEPLQFRAYQTVFQQNQVAFEIADWPQWHRLEASARRWIDAHELKLDAELIRAQKKQVYEKLIADELTLKPGALELVESLSGQCRLCVASGSRVESIQACLEKFSLGSAFEQILSATSLPRKKPHPDVYLEVLRVMQVAAENTLAIEDSPSGLQAAIAASVKCVVCPDGFCHYPQGAFEGAISIVESLNQLDLVKLEKLLEVSV